MLRGRLPDRLHGRARGPVRGVVPDAVSRAAAEQGTAERAVRGDQVLVQRLGPLADLQGLHRAVREPHGDRAADADHIGPRGPGQLRLAQPLGDVRDPAVETVQLVHPLQLVRLIGLVAHLRIVLQRSGDHPALVQQIRQLLLQRAPRLGTDRLGITGHTCSSRQGSKEIDANR
ncbi:hypothetical protein SGPA1_21564 [Streptomyces misionensis JCM 4497]